MNNKVQYFLEKKNGIYEVRFLKLPFRIIISFLYDSKIIKNKNVFYGEKEFIRNKNILDFYKATTSKPFKNYKWKKLDRLYLYHCGYSNYFYNYWVEQCCAFINSDSINFNKTISSYIQAEEHFKKNLLLYSIAIPHRFVRDNYTMVLVFSTNYKLIQNLLEYINQYVDVEKLNYKWGSI